MAGLNWTIAAAYIFIAAVMVPRLALPRAPKLMGAAFLVACAFTHLDLAHHALAHSNPFLVAPHMFVIHGAQAAVDWGFILLGFRHGRLMIRANEERVREYARAAAAEHAAAAEQRALSRIATAVAAESEPEAVFALVAEEAAGLLGMEAAAVVRFEGPGAATLVGTWSAAEPTAQAGASVDLDQAPAIAAVHRTGRSARADGPGSTLAAPVLVGQRLWGVVTAEDHRADPIADEAESRLERLAELVGLAVSSTEARQALRKSEQRFRTLTTHAPVGIFEVDPRGRCLFVNDRWAEMSGIAPSEAVGASWGRGLHWLDHERVVQAWHEATRSGSEFVAEYRYMSADGQARWVAGRAVALRDENGALTGHLGTVMDISDRKRAEDELARHASLLRAVLDASPDGICLVDLEGDVLLSNAALDQLLPWERAAELQRLEERNDAIAELTTDPSAFRAASAALGGDPATQMRDEFELVPSGAVLQRHSRAVTLDGVPDAVLGRLFLFRDVTAERRAERAKDEFIALASHELRTPLTSIQGYVEMLQEGDDEPLGDRQKRHLAVVMRNARRLAMLVDDLLLVARADAGRLALGLDQVDLGELVRECVQASGPAALERGIVLEARPAPALARGDLARLGQVLDNLVSNALKFTPHGGRVVVSARTDDQWSVLEVTDTGMGISPEDQARLFERFFRASGAVEAAIPGTGLGLAISKMIVEAHGGQMVVHSAEGEGSTFRVLLPR